MEKQIEFRNRRGKILRGMLHLPSSRRAQRVPAVIFFHGFTGDRHGSHWIFIKCARALMRRGIASLRFDFYGSGESEGEFRRMRLANEIKDALDAAKFFRKQKDIDPLRVGICGLSMGGAVASCTARRAQAKAIVLWSAVGDTRILLKLAGTRARGVPGQRGAYEYEAREIGPGFIRNVVKVNPSRELARFGGPTLIIHGDRDEIVPHSHAGLLFEACPAKIKRKVLIAGADHTYTSIAWEREVIGLTAKWFKRFL